MRKIITLLLFCIMLQSKNAMAQTNLALNFDGSNDYINVGNWWNYEEFTVELWIKPSSTQVAYANIIDNNHVGGIRWVCQKGPDGINEWTFGCAGTIELGHTVFTLIPDVWQHLALVKTSTEVRVYVNGTLVRSDSYAGTIAGGGTGDNIWIGNWNHGGRNFNGSMDEIRLWSIVRTQAEIQSKLYCELQGSETNLVAYYKLNQGTAGGNNTSITTAIDGSSHSHAGSLVGFDLTGPGSNFVSGADNINSSCCVMTVSAGADEHLLFGYPPNQCKTKTVVVTDGTAPFTYSWTLSRALLPEETMTGANTASVTICLMDTAELCVTLTDAANCTATDCANIFAEDVRCGNGNNQKTTICHNGNTICVDNSAVPAHLDHGDYVGACAETMGRSRDHTDQASLNGMNIFPNPGKGEITVSFNWPGFYEGNTILQIINSNGQVVKTMSTGNHNSVQFRMDVPGVYIARMINGKETIQKRFVVIK